MNQQSETGIEAQYPAVKLAFDFSVERSYAWMLDRYKDMDNRLQAMQAFVTTLTLGGLVISKALLPTISFLSGWFVMALLVYAVAIALGAVGLLGGKMTHVSPAVIYERWLHLSDWEFKKDALFFAGQHYDKNRAVVNRKGVVLGLMHVALVVELALIAVGLTTHR